MATTKSIGPLLRVIYLMSQDMIKFNVIFFTIILSSASVATCLLNGGTTLDHYTSFEISVRTLYSSALGIFNLEIFEDDRYFREAVLGVFMIICNVMMLHFLIAVLTNVYER